MQREREWVRERNLQESYDLEDNWKMEKAEGHHGSRLHSVDNETETC